MPIFEYRCLKCEAEFEKLILGKEVEVRCPSCDSAEVAKKFSAFAFKHGDKFVASAGPTSCGPCTPATPSACSTCPVTRR